MATSKEIDSTVEGVSDSGKDRGKRRLKGSLTVGERQLKAALPMQMAPYITASITNSRSKGKAGFTIQMVLCIKGLSMKEPIQA